MKNRVLIAAASAILVCAAPATAATSPYTALYAFGDSLSDAGNLYLLSLNPAYGIPNQPLPPYYQTPLPSPPPVSSAGVFSNGPVWTQDLSLALGLGPLLPSNFGGSDYAYGGATTGATGIDLPSQVSAFLANGAAPSSALYTIWIGANDVLGTLEALKAGVITETQADAFVYQAVQREAAAIGALVAGGAKSLLVFDLPNLGVTPRYNASAQKAQASALSLLYNNDLSAALSGIAGGTIDEANPYYIIDYVVNNGAKYGLDNTTSACWTGTASSGPSGGTECLTPDRYLFWDSIHPTAAGHEILTDLALSTLGISTPEPSSWAMLALGFAGLGALGARKAARRAKSV